VPSAAAGGGGLWWAVSFVCFFAAIFLIARAVAPGHAVAIASCVLVTQAAYANLRLGQVAWPLMLLLTGAWLADRSRRPMLCGVLIGAAAAWKPFLLVFAPYLLWAPGVARDRHHDGNHRCDYPHWAAGRWPAGYESWLASLRSVGWAGHPLNASLRGLLTRGLTMPTLTEQPTTPLIVAPAWLEPAWLAAAAAAIAVGVKQIVVARNVDAAWATLR
jgi:hypothetical protein